ncbi:uncharacterized protein Dana_GF23660 [Drosophila ananassae]|uniref:Spermatogenesis-associated protein 6 N-terminal domain-containing protein n=1 Tax=Drosophila ananassae TaxID=7217 RepID=B3M7P0_DROAN|nr:uncharacterized protein LOC6506301 [Drosophila ananassae]EDV40968.1 uncharacterized protein Dana_GF23660 [Drosophila ananassae]
MSHKRFYVRLDLQLHALTCPGVWLCSHGYLEATIKTLGYYFRTGAMEPRFPMLCHDQFTMEGYFKSVGCLEELHDLLRSEQLEITLWQNGRRLAYFVGNLSDVMHPTVPRLSCPHSSNVQLLMKATPAFPGILAPKVELSAKLSTQDRRKGCSCSSLRDESVAPPVPVANRHVNSRCLGQTEQPRKQQTVCHGRKSNCCPNWKYPSYPDQPKPPHRRLSTCSGSTQMSSVSQSSSLTQCSHLSSCSDLVDEHQRSCDICQTYRRMFPAY